MLMRPKEIEVLLRTILFGGCDTDGHLDVHIATDKAGKGAISGRTHGCWTRMDPARNRLASSGCDNHGRNRRTSRFQGQSTANRQQSCQTSTSGTSTVAIDNKIEQAMDLVKSHLMFAVREEVEVLKERISELMDRIQQLEYENTILKSHASQETLAQLSQPPPKSQPPGGPPSSTS